MEIVGGLAIIVAVCVPFLALTIVTLRPTEGRRKIRARCRTQLALPQMCVITGEPTKELRAIRLFSGSMWGLPTLTRKEVWLPFTPAGWARYREEFPVSLRVFKAGLDILFRIPLMGAALAILLWTPYGGIASGVLALSDLWRGKHQLVRLRQVRIKDGQLHEVDMDVVDERFALEFRRLNANAEFDRPWWRS